MVCSIKTYFQSECFLLKKSLSFGHSIEFYHIIAPLVIKDGQTGVFTIIGVTCDAPYTWEQYRSGPYATYSRVSAVLSWIHETMENS